MKTPQIAEFPRCPKFDLNLLTEGAHILLNNENGIWEYEGYQNGKYIFFRYGIGTNKIIRAKFTPDAARKKIKKII